MTWTAKERETLRMMLEQRYKLSVIAKRLQRTYAQVKSASRRFGFTPKRKHGNNVLRRRVRLLYARGYSDQEIAERLHVAKQHVWRVRKRLGLPPNITRQQSGRYGGIASGVARRNAKSDGSIDSSINREQVGHQSIPVDHQSTLIDQSIED